MKSYKNILTIIVAGTIMFASCKDDKFLEEVSKDKLTVDLAFTNKAQFDGLSATFYKNLQLLYSAADQTHEAFILGLGTDVMFDPRDNSVKFNNWGLVNAQEAFSADFFNLMYDNIKIANTLISAASKPGVVFASDAEKAATIAEGRFFRGFAYRNLANAYGGVPIVSEPVTTAKVDFVRNTREECWAFAKADLEYARLNLPLTTTVIGRVNRAAADHFLAEVNISLKDYDGAIAAATRVIDGTDGAYALVKTRFGSRNTTASYDVNKDYYYDLFAMGNQNRQAGNTEGLLVAQFEVTATGGVIPGGVTVFTRPLIERMMWSQYWGLTKAGYKSVAQDSTGRGVAFVKPTNYANYNIWSNSGTDMRNNETNIKRKFYFGPDIAASSGYLPGQLIPKAFLTAREDTMQYIYPNWAKFGTDKHIGGIPDNGYVRDFYVARLPETYFLRAEAYLRKARTDLAMADLNFVRDRAKATLLTNPAIVTIDYILDERARELFGEEFRLLTLTRLGLLYDRTNRFGNPASAASVSPNNNLMPIPQTAIDRNVGAKMLNNPGY